MKILMLSPLLLLGQMDLRRPAAVASAAPSSISLPSEEGALSLLYLCGKLNVEDTYCLATATAGYSCPPDPQTPRPLVLASSIHQPPATDVR